MALNYKAVANILKEKGREDFKPFKTDFSAMEVWGFKTKESDKTDDVQEISEASSQPAEQP